MNTTWSDSENKEAKETSWFLLTLKCCCKIRAFSPHISGVFSFIPRIPSLKPKNNQTMVMEPKIPRSRSFLLEIVTQLGPFEGSIALFNLKLAGNLPLKPETLQFRYMLLKHTNVTIFYAKNPDKTSPQPAHQTHKDQCFMTNKWNLMEPTWAFKKPNSISHQIWKSQVVQPLFSLQTFSVFPLQTSAPSAFLCICEACKPIKTTPFLELNTEEGYLPIMPSNKLKQTLVIIWATCEEIIKEIKGKRKKKLGLFYIWLFLYHPQSCAIKKKHPQWKKRERNTLHQKLIGPELVSIKFQLESIIRVRKKKWNVSLPLFFFLFKPHNPLILSLQFWCPACWYEVGHIIISSSGGGRFKQKQTKPNIKITQTIKPTWNDQYYFNLFSFFDKAIFNFLKSWLWMPL